MGMMNKKGQGLSVETVILIVIGVLVLVFLILGFTMGWNKIFPFINPPNNVKDISDKCGYACQTDDKYGYCSSKREVTTESAITIKDDKDKDIVFEKKIAGSCYELSAIATLGMPACLNIVCDSPYVFGSENLAKAACVKSGVAGQLKYRNPAGQEASYDCSAKSA
jgi:hypothetical protein